MRGMLRFALLKKHLTALRDRRGPLRTLGDGGLLPMLLIAALLLCHGVLGYAHQVSCGACEPTEISGVHHGFATETGESGAENTGADTPDGLGHLSYAAVVLAAFGAILLVLLEARRWHEAPPPRSIFRRHHPPFITRRPRGPTLPSLQVLRL